jgi:hypothetical protein
MSMAKGSTAGFPVLGGMAVMGLKQAAKIRARTPKVGKGTGREVFIEDSLECFFAPGKRRGEKSRDPEKGAGATPWGEKDGRKKY